MPLMTSASAEYLPILLFLGVALALSSAFVFLPMGVARLTGTHNPTPEKLSEYLDTIRAEAARLTALVQRVLEFSRVQQQRIFVYVVGWTWARRVRHLPHLQAGELRSRPAVAAGRRKLRGRH